MTELTCGHCGGVAFASDLLYDGEGDACRTCGFPGHVGLDDDPEYPAARWVKSSAVDARCDLPDCEVCP